MGCWNGTCAISNLHITAGERVAVFMLAENRNKDGYSYTTSTHSICPLPFYGKYDDYGGVEDCHGFGLNIVVESLRKKLYKFGKGPNPYHDVEVNKENFNIELLFEADQEDRLGIEDHSSYNPSDYSINELEKKKSKDGLSDSELYELDRLMGKIKKVDAFRRVTHVTIHGKVFDSILENWYLEEYVGDGKGTHGYNNNYTRVYFKDVVASIPEYISMNKESIEKAKAEISALLNSSDSVKSARLFMSLSRLDAEWNHPNHAVRLMRSFEDSGYRKWEIVDAREMITDYRSNENWEEFSVFTEEALKAVWINSFMSYTRKIWTKQCGAGSQSQAPLGYEILANTVLKILKEEKEEYSDDDED